jgi:hypothetical protein
MGERLMAKLDRLGAEAGIKQMTPEMYRFAQLLNDDKLKQWDEWRSQRAWVDLAPAQIQDIYLKVLKEYSGAPQMQGQFAFAAALQNKIREENT